MTNLVDILRADYQRFPKQQTYAIYAKDVYFKDPLNEFRGLDRYQQMIQFIDRWFQNPRLDLQVVQQQGQQILTDWTLSWTTPVPWQPRIQISGWTEMQVNAEGLICSHIDYWHCSPWDVVRQHFQS